MSANVAGWVAGTAPRAVLLHIGTNDVIQNFDLAGAPGRLSGLIDRITSAAPGADVFVASITPLADPGGRRMSTRTTPPFLALWPARVRVCTLSTCPPR
ncbi:GDSL-type esterase/lipase family protein [Dactylosporangium cerinum]